MFKTISGEAKSVTEEMFTSWLETTILLNPTILSKPKILSRYPLQDIFFADEFRPFYQCMPIKACHFKKEKCTGGKHCKAGLTRMVARNVNGERLRMFVIGKL